MKSDKYVLQWRLVVLRSASERWVCSTQVSRVPRFLFTLPVKVPQRELLGNHAFISSTSAVGCRDGNEILLCPGIRVFVLLFPVYCPGDLRFRTKYLH